MMRETFLQGSPLVVGLQACNLEGMSNGQLVLVERLLRFGNELNQAQSSADVRGRPANAGRDGFDGVRVGLGDELPSFTESTWTTFGCLIFSAALISFKRASLESAAESAPSGRSLMATTVPDDSPAAR